MNAVEMLETFDTGGNARGLYPRTECHRNNTLAHRAVHILVFDSRGDIVLQKRSGGKDLFPHYWDTSVGGHLMPGEPYEAAAMRECAEELGFKPSTLAFLYRYTMAADHETELVETFATVCDGPFTPDPAEVEEIGRFALSTLLDGSAGLMISPFFKRELEELEKYLAQGGSLR